MSMAKGFLLLILLLGGAVLLWLRQAPSGFTTPSRAAQTMIDDADRLGAQPSDRISERLKLLPENNPGGVAAPASPLVELIAATGFPCARVTHIAPIRAGDGIWAITCRDRIDGAAAERRFRVDTRQGKASIDDSLQS